MIDGQHARRERLHIRTAHRDKTVMFDCGIHPAFKGMDSLPLLDEIDIDTVDVALITHFHLDHCAAVPYLLRKTRFKVRDECGGRAGVGGWAA